MPQGSLVSVPQSPSPDTWQPSRPTAWPIAIAGAKMSAPVSHGMRWRLSHSVDASVPPRNPPYQASPLPEKRKRRGSARNAGKLSNTIHRRAPTIPPRAAHKTASHASERSSPWRASSRPTAQPLTTIASARKIPNQWIGTGPRWRVSGSTLRSLPPHAKFGQHAAGRSGNELRDQIDAGGVVVHVTAGGVAAVEQVEHAQAQLGAAAAERVRVRGGQVEHRVFRDARVLALGVVDEDASDVLGLEACADAARAGARAEVAHGGGEEAERLAVVAHVVGGRGPVVLGVAHEVVVAEGGVGLERGVHPLAPTERAAPPAPGSR